MIALTVEEGEDWKDVQIPSTKQGDAAPPKVESAAPAKEATTQGIATSDIHVEHVPGVGPASTLLMAQYGIDPRYNYNCCTKNQFFLQTNVTASNIDNILYFLPF